MRRHFWTITVYIAAICSAACGVARAQQTTKWPEKQDKPRGVLPVDLVTVSEPGVRHRCRVHAITEDQIVCGVGFAQKAVTYRREDVAAIIVPPDHSTRTANILYLAAAAGCVAASFFPPATVAVVLLRIGAGAFIFAALTNIWDDDDHKDDRVVHQRAGTPLSITLRK
jgi:hypothetical protein